MTERKFELSLKEIRQLCSRYHVHEMALFGSFQQGEKLPEIDIYFFKDFPPDDEIHREGGLIVRGHWRLSLLADQEKKAW